MGVTLNIIATGCAVYLAIHFARTGHREILSRLYRRHIGNFGVAVWSLAALTVVLTAFVVVGVWQ